MKHRIHFAEDAGLVTSIPEGKSSTLRLISALEEIFNDPRWRPGFSILSDSRKLDLQPLLEADLAQLSRRFLEFEDKLGDGRIAIVTGRDSDFLVARAWERITDGAASMTIRAFRDFDQGRAWIDHHLKTHPPTASTMRHRLAIDLDRQLCTVTTQGPATVQGIIAFLNDIIAHPQWRPGFSILLDHRELAVEGIDNEGVVQVSQHFIKISGRLGRGRLALTMNKDIDFGIARAWEMITENSVDMSICVFRDLDRARAWVRGEG